MAEAARPAAAGRWPSVHRYGREAGRAPAPAHGRQLGSPGMSGSGRQTGKRGLAAVLAIGVRQQSVYQRKTLAEKLMQRKHPRRR
jgi:hypothetical protein